MPVSPYGESICFSENNVKCLHYLWPFHQMVKQEKSMSKVRSQQSEDQQHPVIARPDPSGRGNLPPDPPIKIRGKKGL
jgi:hypothetical protein